MNKFIANIIFITHSFLVIFILLGWIIPKIWILYISVIIITLLSEIIFGYCPLSKLEFDMRKKINPNLNYDYSFASFYTYKITSKFLSERFVSTASYTLLIFLLLINIYFHYFFEVAQDTSLW